MTLQTPPPVFNSIEIEEIGYDLIVIKPIINLVFCTENDI